MSKLYKSYEKLKEKCVDKIYIFKSGMFYICLEEDAKKISEIFGFKMTKLNEKVMKAGFPISRLDYYVEQLNNRKIPFEIVDSDYSKIENYEDYMNNNKLKNIIKTVKKIDLNNITFRDAYNILENLKQKIEQIY